MENEFSNRISVKNIVLAGMFAAFLAVMSQVSRLRCRFLRLHWWV